MKKSELIIILIIIIFPILSIYFGCESRFEVNQILNENLNEMKLQDKFGFIYGIDYRIQVILECDDNEAFVEQSLLSIKSVRVFVNEGNDFNTSTVFVTFPEAYGHEQYTLKHDDFILGYEDFWISSENAESVINSVMFGDGVKNPTIELTYEGTKQIKGERNMIIPYGVYSYEGKDVYEYSEYVDLEMNTFNKILYEEKGQYHINVNLINPYLEGCGRELSWILETENHIEIYSRDYIGVFSLEKQLILKRIEEKVSFSNLQIITGLGTILCVVGGEFTKRILNKNKKREVKK